MPGIVPSNDPGTAIASAVYGAVESPVEAARH